MTLSFDMVYYTSLVIEEKWVKLLRLDINFESIMSNITHINIVKIFNKLFKKMNIIKIQNLIVT